MIDNINYFRQACRNIVDNKNAKAVNYAVDYAVYGLTINDKYEAHVQALYILNNITYWRGPIANETRSILKNVAKYWKG